MYREKAKELLEILHSSNKNKNPQYINVINIRAQRIIKSIINECKSTVIIQQGDKKVSYRFESLITKESVEAIVNEFLANSSRISKHTMNRILYDNGTFIGINEDVPFYKEFNIDNVGGKIFIPKIIINQGDIVYPGIKSELEEIFKKYARDIIIYRLEPNMLSKISRYRIFREMVIHRRYTEERCKNDYKHALWRGSGITNEEALNRTAKYVVEQMYSEEFIDSVIKNITNEKLVNNQSKGEYDFNSLQSKIAKVVSKQYGKITDLNMIIRDIYQIFKDIEAQLTAYTVDFRKMTLEQIENEIKRINRLTLKDEKIKYLGEDGYRNGEAFLDKEDLGLFMSKENVQKAMKSYVQAIDDFVRYSNEISNEEYVKKATMLMYRFIRIHPFPDSNGRTSRAILNMLTLNRNILISINKEEKKEFIKILKELDKNIGDNYLNTIYENPRLASKMEEENIEELANFIMEHSTLSKLNELDYQREEGNENLEHNPVLG